MYILGINAAFHDSSACLLNDGKIIAAAEEERFTGIKHGKRPVPFSAYELPFHAIHYCLKEAGIHLKEVQHVAYAFDPAIFPGDFKEKGTVTLPLKPHLSDAEVAAGRSPWDPLFYMYVRSYASHLTDGYPHHLEDRFRGIKDGPQPQWHFVDHHLSHAASAFYVSPFEKAAILVLDGRGESATTTYALGKGRHIDVLGQVHMPHSLGILYEKITDFLGFLHSSDEYKVMALASYGEPEYLDVFRSMIRLTGNGMYEIHYPDFEAVLGPRRRRGATFEQRHFNIAHSLQAALEEAVFELASCLRERTGEDNLCMAGGVALNCVMNGRLRQKEIFKNIWVQPAAGDAGTALGAAFALDARYRRPSGRYEVMRHAYYGPAFSDEEIRAFLESSKLPFQRLDNVAEHIADLLRQDRIIGLFNGRMEFGPRALGSRSIIASPLSEDMQARLNTIKDREDFRPVAPAVLEEQAAEWFLGGAYSPFMLFVYDVVPDKKARIPAVTHCDGTARIQTVNRKDNALYHDIIQAFYKSTGVPVIINTSFNSRGKPIVCTPRDAVDCFFTSPLDDLVLGSFLLSKTAVNMDERPRGFADARPRRAYEGVSRDPDVQTARFAERVYRLSRRANSGKAGL